MGISKPKLSKPKAPSPVSVGSAYLDKLNIQRESGRRSHEGARVSGSANISHYNKVIRKMRERQLGHKVGPFDYYHMLLEEKEGVDYNDAPEPSSVQRTLLEDPEIFNTLIDAIRKGTPPSTACAMAGIHKATMMKWLKYGHEGRDRTVVQFWRAVRMAEAASESDAAESLAAAGSEDWRAALSYLERRFPERWRKQTERNITVDGSVDVNHKHQLAQVVSKDDDARALLRRLIDKQPSDNAGGQETVIDATYTEVDQGVM